MIYEASISLVQRMTTDVLYIKGTLGSLTKAGGDIVADKSQYADLLKVPGWRLLLSDSGVSPFQWNGKQWETAENAINSVSSSTESLDEIWRAKFTQNEKARSTLALTGQAQLWTMRGKKTRWTALENIRSEIQKNTAQGNTAQGNTAQRNATAEAEMADAPKTLKTKGKKTSAVVAPSAPPASQAINAFVENTVATVPVKEAHITPPDLDAAEETESSLKFCPVCDNYLYMEVSAESKGLTRLCRKCGHKEEDTKGGLVMEMMIQQQSSEGYKILLNEFTRKDPRLPHIRKNISCPNVTCDSNKGGKDPDVIYIKYDLVNLMYLYICDICGEKWHSRDRN